MNGTLKSVWQETTLGEVIELYDHKRIPLNGGERNKRQSFYPYYGASGIIDYIDDYIFNGTYLLIAEDGENLNSRKTPIAFFAKGKFWVNNHAHIVRAVDGKADDYFLMSFLETSDISGYITGTAQPKLSQANLKAIKLRLPPLPTQQKIASILSAYDDLIENNTRRITILEEMAQMLYREWFVNFRFPGHEQIKMVESELGRTPEGWEVKPLKQLCKLVQYGYTAKAQKEPVGLKFLRITDIVPHWIDWDSVPYCSVSEKNLDKYLLEEGDIVIARTGATVGYAKRIDSKAPKSIFASYLVRVRVQPEYDDNYIGLILESDEYKRFVQSNMGGAAQPNANAQVLTSLPIFMPSKNVQNAFREVISDLFNQRAVLRAKIANLHQTRDLLLPALRHH